MEERLSPEEGNELLGAIAVVEVAGKVPGEEFLLDRDTPSIRSGEQTDYRGDCGQTARCDGASDPGHNRSQIPGMTDKSVRPVGMTCCSGVVPSVLEYDPSSVRIDQSRTPSPVASIASPSGPADRGNRHIRRGLSIGGSTAATA
jgi:hypothetical protein